MGLLIVPSCIPLLTFDKESSDAQGLSYDFLKYEGHAGLRIQCRTRARIRATNSHASANYNALNIYQVLLVVPGSAARLC
jgi:hypothetical protein